MELWSRWKRPYSHKIGGSSVAAIAGHVASVGMPNMDGEGDRSDDAGLRSEGSNGNPCFPCVIDDVHHRKQRKGSRGLQYGVDVRRAAWRLLPAIASLQRAIDVPSSYDRRGR